MSTDTLASYFEEMRDATMSVRSHLGFAQLDAGGHFLTVNRAYVEMLGGEPDELVGRDWKSSTHPDDYDCMDNAFRVAREHGVAYVEIRGIRKDDSLIHQTVIVTRIAGPSGAFDGFYCFRYDVTGHMRDQEALALAVESAPNGLLMLNSAGQIQMANAAVERLFGYSRQELLGRKVEVLLPVRYRNKHEGHRALFGRSDSMKAMAGRNLRGLRKDGAEIPLQVYLNTIDMPGGKLILCTIIDIAERERYQEQLELAKQAAESANRAKSDFLARMSHEIRTPMNLIMGMNALLLESNLDEKQRKHVEISYRNVRRLLRLINEILDLSKVEAGKLTLELVPFDLKEVLEESSATMAASFEQKGLEMGTRLDPEIWRYLMGDPERLQQILLNLLGNASKFTAEGRIDLRVATQASRDGKEWMRFEVSDTGCGIPADKQDLIFQAFQQGEGSMNRTYEGTGLGLAIAKTLVEMMGGRIWVEPKSGPGTTIVFTAGFPRATPHAAGGRADELARTKTRKLTSGTRILIADDNEENVFLLQAYLEGQPVVIDVAANGVEAVEKRRLQEYDVILMDIQMPLMDGHAAAREIRSWEKARGSGRTPIVALTAHALAGAANQSEEAGCDGYLSKPVRQKDLIETISRYALSHRGSGKAELAGIRALRPKYLANRQNDLKTIRAALDAGDFATIRRIAHDCKGTGTGYGFPEISEVGAKLEQAAIRADATDVHARIQDMEAHVIAMLK